MTVILGALGVTGAWSSRMPMDRVPSLEALIVGLSIMPLVAAAVCLWRWWRNKNVTVNGDSRLQSRLKSLRCGVWLGVAMLLPVLVTLWATRALWLMAGWPLEDQDVLRLLVSDDATAWVRGVIILYAVLIAPVTEEILYRGILLSAVLRHGRPWRGVLLVSLFFGAMHLNATVFPALTLAGLFFADGYRRTGSLLTPIAMHVVFNASNLLFAFFS